VKIYFSKEIILIPGLVELIEFMMLSIIDVSLPLCQFSMGFLFLIREICCAGQTLEVNIVNVTLSVLRIAILNLHV
jgi:hypothetical protein